MVAERFSLTDDPLLFTIGIATRNNTEMGRTISGFIDTNVPGMPALMENVFARITASSGSRCAVYRSLNPSLTLHRIYRDRHTVNDRFRIAFTRFRVSSHSLCIETGRWNRRGRGRLPPEERLCSCGEIQTERHVVESCPATSDIRRNAGLTCVRELFNGKYAHDVACKIVYDILKVYS